MFLAFLSVIENVKMMTNLHVCVYSEEHLHCCCSFSFMTEQLLCVGLKNNNLKGLIQPLRDDMSPGEVGPFDAEAAALQRYRQRVLEGDFCSQFPILLWFTQDLQSTGVSKQWAHSKNITVLLGPSFFVHTIGHLHVLLFFKDFFELFVPLFLG